MLSEKMKIPETKEELSKILKETQTGISVIPWGSGTHQGIGHYPEKKITDPDILGIGSERLNRILDYSKKDFIITVEVGIKLKHLQTFLNKEMLFFPFFSVECENRSLGGILAAASFNSLSYRYGLIRDLVLGLTVCHSDGTITKSGGKVVKNVSGYEMQKLHIGSLGTLGYLISCTLKVSSIPEKKIFLHFDIEEPGVGIEKLNRFFTSNLSLTGVFLKLKFNSSPQQNPCHHLTVWIFGKERSAEFIKNEILTTVQSSKTKAPSEFTEKEAENFLDLSTPINPEETQNISEILCSGFIPPSIFFELYKKIENLSIGLNFSSDLLLSLQGSFSCSWKWNGKTPENILESFHELNHFVSQKGGWIRYEKVPLPLWKDWEMWGEKRPEWKISRELKKIFDPKGILNPGRFVLKT